MKFFLHIPKSGGTSLAKALTDAFGIENSIRFHSKSLSPTEIDLLFGGGLAAVRQRLRLSIIEVRNASKFQFTAFFADDRKLLSGHFNADLLRENHLSSVFTVLRDPVERVLSSYYYYRRLLSDEHTSKIAKAVDLMTYCTKQSLTEADNGVIRRLTGCLNENIGYVGREQFDDASRRLRQYGQVQILENFNHDLFEQFFRLKIPSVPVLNSSPRNSCSPPAQVIQSIRDKNYWDLRLYDKFFHTPQTLLRN